jgi:hypothetical protein
MRRLGGTGILLLALAGCGAPESTAPAPKNDAASGNGVDLDGLKSKVPDSWKEEPLRNRMRMANYRIGTDVTVVVFILGGSAEANVERWRKAFSRTDVEPKEEKFNVGPLKMTQLDMRGTYEERDMSNPNLAPMPREHYRRITVYVDGPKQPYQIIMGGPADEVDKHKAEFDEWLKAFK